MTKNELVRELAEDFELPRKQVADLIEGLIEKITAVLKSGDKVQLAPLGQFKIRDRAARIARNPQTGEPVNVPASAFSSSSPASRSRMRSAPRSAPPASRRPPWPEGHSGQESPGEPVP